MLEVTVKTRTEELVTSNQLLNKAVDEERQSRLSMMEIKNYLRNIIDSMPSVLIGVDLDGKVTQWNVAAQKMTGLSLNEVVGMPLGQAYPRLSNETTGIQDAINTSQERSDLNRPFLHNNITYYEDMTIYPLIADGVKGAVIRLDDVTEKVKLEQQFRRVQKMDALDQLTGGIAHDFNNILGIILGNVDLLLVHIKDDEKTLNRVETIKRTAERAVVLIKQLLSFSREDPDQISSANINHVVGKMDNLIARSLTPEIEIEHYFASDLWETDIDTGKLEDAILNLVINARDAMPSGGKLIFETSNCSLDDVFCSQNPGFAVGDYVQLSISDNGEGISPEVQERLFEPFFTTKAQGKGTGLGLAMVFGFLKSSRGHIKVYSESGHGACFRLYLPRSKSTLKGEDNSNSATERTKQVLSRGTEKILVVDDESALREVVKESLETLGYRVVTAATGQEALDILEKESDINLLFSDVVMPEGVNGYDLAKETMLKWPEIKVLLTSGFTGKVVADYRSDQPKVTLLDKPYSISNLASHLRTLLDE